MPFTISYFKVSYFSQYADPENSAPLEQAEGQGPILTPGSPHRANAAPLSPERFPAVSDPYDLYDKESELVLPCFVMMLDLTLKQVCFVFNFFKFI